MMKNKTIQVDNHWFNDSGDVETVLLKPLVIVNNKGEVLRQRGGMFGGCTFNSKKKYIAFFSSEDEANIEMRLFKNGEGMHIIPFTEFKHNHEDLFK